MPEFVIRHIIFISLVLVVESRNSIVSYILRNTTLHQSFSFALMKESVVEVETGTDEECELVQRVRDVNLRCWVYLGMLTDYLRLSARPLTKSIST